MSEHEMRERFEGERPDPDIVFRLYLVLPAKDREVLNLALGLESGEPSVDEAAKALGVTRSKVRERMSRAIWRLGIAVGGKEWCRGELRTALEAGAMRRRAGISEDGPTPPDCDA